MLGFGLGDAGPLEHAGEAVAAAERRDQIDGRPFRRVHERLDRFGRGHAAAGIGAVGERSDGKGARLLPLRVGQRRRHRARQSAAKPGRERPGGVAKRGAGREAAEPFAGADPNAEIGDQIEVALDGAACAGCRSRAGWRPPKHVVEGSGVPPRRPNRRRSG